MQEGFASHRGQKGHTCRMRRHGGDTQEPSLRAGEPVSEPRLDCASAPLGEESPLTFPLPELLITGFLSYRF